MDRGGWLLVGALLVGTWAVAACRPIGGGGGQSVGCTSFLSDAACTEQADVVAARHPGATDVSLTCTSPVCDRAGGSGTASITLQDGSVVRDTFSYVGNAAPMPQPACIGLAVDTCRGVAATQFNQAPTSKVVVAISITCTAQPCTPTGGQVDYRLRYADGSTDEGSIGWDGAMP